MSDSKTHNTSRPLMRHVKYGIVDIFPVGKLQKQEKNFYTIDVSGVPFNSIDEARSFILEPVMETVAVKDGLETYQKKRRKFEIDKLILKKSELSKLVSDRHLSIQWARFNSLIKDVSLD